MVCAKIDLGICKVNNHARVLEAEMKKMIRNFKNSNISHLESMKKQFMQEASWTKEQLNMEQTILHTNSELSVINEVFEVEEKEKLDVHLRNIIFENLCGSKCGDFEVGKNEILKNAIIEKLSFLEYEFSDNFLKNIGSQIDQPIAALSSHLKCEPDALFQLTKSQKSDKIDQPRKEKKKYVFLFVI